MKALIGAVGTLLCMAASAWGADVEGLVKQLKDQDPDVRRSAAKALGEAGADSRSAVTALAQALKDRDRFVRRFSAQSLGEIGAEARAAVPALGALLKDARETKEVLEAAVTALGKMGADGVEPLMAAVKDTGNEPVVRRKAVEALGVIGSAARSAIPLLTDVLAGKDLGKKGPVRNGDIRAEAAEALGSIASADDKVVVEALQGLATDKKVRDRNIKKAASDAIKKIQSKS